MVSCLLPLPRFESLEIGGLRKLPVTWGKAVIFARYSGFLNHLQLAHKSRISRNMAEQLIKNEISNPKKDVAMIIGM